MWLSLFPHGLVTFSCLGMDWWSFVSGHGLGWGHPSQGLDWGRTISLRGRTITPWDRTISSWM